MKKSLFVIAVLVVACSFASAASYSFGFLSPSGGGPYCNYEQLNNNGIYVVSADVWEGQDNLSNCGYSYNAPISGFGGSVPLSAGLPVKVGKGAIYGDGIYDALSAAFTGYQWTVATDLSCKKNKHWIGVAGYNASGGYVFGDNYGPMSCTLAPRGGHNGMASNGMKVK